MSDIHSCSYYCDRPECIKVQRDELRDRLAQPEQEPLQFKCTIVDDAHPNGVPLSQWGKQPEQEPVHNVQSNGRHSPLLTHMMNKQTTPPKRPWVGLTDEEEIDQIAEQLDETTIGWSTHEFARAIEAKLKEKNNG